MSSQLLQLVRILRKASAPRGQAAQAQMAKENTSAGYAWPMLSTSGAIHRRVPVPLCVHRSMFLTCGGMRGRSLRFCRASHQEDVVCLRSLCRWPMRICHASTDIKHHAQSSFEWWARHIDFHQPARLSASVAQTPPAGTRVGYRKRQAGHVQFQGCVHN